MSVGHYNFMHKYSPSCKVLVFIFIKVLNQVQYEYTLLLSMLLMLKYIQFQILYLNNLLFTNILFSRYLYG